jgi:hypothetical protein
MWLCIKGTWQNTRWWNTISTMMHRCFKIWWCQGLKKMIINTIHEEIGHFSEQWILAKVKKVFLAWLDWICKENCSRAWTLLDGEGIWKPMFQNWGIKKIPICDLFYKVAFDTIGPLMAIKTNKNYVLIAIDHYF